MRKSAIMPPQKGNGPLDIVIATMAFLAALALCASLIVGRTAASWRAGLSGTLTVQILPPDQGSAREGLKQQTEAALQILRATPGIAYAVPMSEEDERALVRPWIGDSETVTELPLPQLIDASIRPGEDVDIAGLAARLKQAVPGAVLDDHSHWMNRLRDLAGTIVWSAYGILFLIAVATAAVVSFATRAGLEMHREIVTLLHQMGAQAGFIARTFEWYYLRATLAAGTVGAALAGGLFLAASGLEFAGIEAVPFLPPLALQPVEFLWLLAVPAASGVIGFFTARLSVLAVLRKIY
jgi:cell division transport system permease protein